MPTMARAQVDQDDDSADEAPVVDFEVVLCFKWERIIAQHVVG